jgi:DNA polymerase-3 subunit delta
LKKQDFDKIIDKQQFNAYLFWGECNYLIQEYANKVIKILNIDNEDILKVYFDEYDYDLIYSHLSQNSLFSPINVALIKTNKKINKKEIDKILKLCETNQNSIVIFTFLDNVDMRSVEKSFKDKFVSVRFFKPYESEVVSILTNIANSYGVQIDNFALLHLYNMHHQNLSLCQKELEKLSLLSGNINSKIIDMYCFGLGNVDINQIIYNLFDKKDIHQDLDNLLQEGFNEIALLRQISDFAVILLKIISYSKIYGTIDIGQIWGYNLPQFIANKQIKLAFKYKDKELIQILNYLQNLELELKSGVIKDTKSYFQAKILSLY